MNRIPLMVLMCALVVGCQPTTKSTTKTTTSSSGLVWNSTTSSWTTPTATPTPTATTSTSSTSSTNHCSARGTGSQTIEYYKISPIVNKGSRTYGQVLWSSNTDSAWSGRSYFSTDSRLNVRFLAKSSPGQATTNYGVSCPYASMPYTKMQITVGVKAIGASTYYSTATLESNVGDCSSVAELTPPTNASTFQLDIMNVKWNYDCDIFYANASTTEKAPYCPYSYVWPTDCFDIELQFSTDYTRDMP